MVIAVVVPIASILAADIVHPLSLTKISCHRGINCFSTCNLDWNALLFALPEIAAFTISDTQTQLIGARIFIRFG